MDNHVVVVAAVDVEVLSSHGNSCCEFANVQTAKSNVLTEHTVGVASTDRLTSDPDGHIQPHFLGYTE